MSEKRFQRLQPEQAGAWLAERPGALLLDARDARHHASGHLAGSTLLDGRNHERLLLREPRSRPVLIYCYHGNASQTWAGMFCDFGFGEVADVVGGWTALERHDHVPPTTPMQSAGRPVLSTADEKDAA
ncbi:MAG: rhodanese-like domain-containing protein [Rhodoferax sp.]|nr:rhodanese-like domain-containing protein [Rhodoferax sp.]